MAKVKISELPALTPATLDTTFVVGISGSTTYKISINQLTSSLDTTFATDLVTAALSSSLDGKLSTSSFNSYTSSYTTDSSSFNSRIISGSAVAGTISSSIQISGLGFITASTPTDLSSLNTISASYLSFTQSYYSASSSFDSRIDGLENATSSYLTSLNGAISSSTQISDLGFVTGSYTTITSFNSLTQSFNQISQSFTTISGSFDSIDFSGINTITASYLSFTQSYYSASASFDTRIDSLENATSSYLTSLNGAISSSAQVLNGSGIYSSSAQLPSGLLSSSLGFVATSSYSTDSASFNSRIISGSAVAGTISGSSQISAFGFISGTYVSSSTYTTDSSSFDSRIDSLENATSSYLTSLNGAISSSSQLTSSFDTRYALSSSISATPTLYLLEAYADVTYTLPGSFTEDPCRYSVVNNTVNVSSSWFNTSTYTFTPQKAGYWEITATYDVYRNSEASMAIKKNNGIVVTAGSFGTVAQQITKIVYLNGSTDFINIVNVGGAANSRSQYAERSWFQARWVGE
jgi:hypothetical protein